MLIQLTFDATPVVAVTAPVQLSKTESFYLMRLIECAKHYAAFDQARFCADTGLDEQGFIELCRHLEELQIIERAPSGMTFIAETHREQLMRLYSNAIKAMRNTSRSTVSADHAKRGGRPARPRISFVLKDLSDEELPTARNYARTVLKGRSRDGVYSAPADIAAQHRDTPEFERYIEVTESTI